MQIHCSHVESVQGEQWASPPRVPWWRPRGAYLRTSPGPNLSPQRQRELSQGFRKRLKKGFGRDLEQLRRSFR